MKKYALLLLSILCSGFILTNAQAAPSSKSAAEFADFYLKGQGSDPVLARMKLCGEVPSKGQENAHQCIHNYTGFEMNIDENVIVWMQFAVPQGDKVNNLVLEMSLNDKVVRKMPLSIEGSIRYRTYKAFKPNQAGLWKARVYIDKAEGVKQKLGEMDIRVGHPLLLTKSL